MLGGFCSGGFCHGVLCLGGLSGGAFVLEPQSTTKDKKITLKALIFVNRCKN